ncbi:Na(+)/H(+) antiporter subunit C [Dietzia sp.]|uniref:Na(+)/H(+) antiporter subunit C n=1 Tax=Dietzia sp. TaxID=1871616 RepID=UPI002FD9A675
MTADFGILLLCGILCAGGVFLLLDRTLLRVILGLMLLSNGINLLILAMGGPPKNPPILGRGGLEDSGDADTVVQALVLTAIVITAGIVAFLLALMYRSYQFTTADMVEDDPEDTKVAARSPGDKASAPDRDRSDDQTTGEPTEMGDLVKYSDSAEEFEKTAGEVAKEERERGGEGTT